MGHYDDCRVSEWSKKESEVVTEDDKIRLLFHIIKNGGEITLYNDSHEWQFPIIKKMMDDGDERIQYEEAPHKMTCVSINEKEIDSKTETKISKFLLSSVDEEGE